MQSRGGNRDVNSVFAHVFGIGGVVHHPHGKEIFTCGSDSAIRAFDRADIDAQPKEIKYHKAGVTCIAFNSRGDCFATGDEDHVVALFTYPECKFDQIATRGTSAITHLAFSPSGNLLAVSEQDTVIKLINVIDTKHINLLKGHTGPVKSVAFDPRGEFLASAGGDGMLRVWRLRDRSTVVAIPSFPTTAADSLQLLRMSWSPDGAVLAIPGGRKIECLKRGQWRDAAPLSGGHTDNTTVVSFSPNGRYLATTGEDKKINVFRMDTREVIGYIEVETVPTGLSWGVRTNSLVVLEQFGNLKQWKEPVPSHMPAPFDTEPVPADKKAASVSAPAASGAPSQDDGSSAKDGSKPATASTMDTKLDDEESDEGADDDEPFAAGAGSPGGTRKRRRLVAIDDKEDEEGGSGKKKKSRRARDTLDSDDDEPGAKEPSQQAPIAMGAASFTASQPPFQPSSSPLGLQRRYLVWNSVGVIVSRQEVSHSAIQIDFHDTNLHRPVRFLDRYNYVAAALSSTGALFASARSDQGSSTIFYKPFETWGNKSDWLFQLEGDESVVCCAVGKKWAAVSTDQNYLRVFSYSGLQTGIRCLPGPVVTMVGEGDSLAVVYSAGGALRVWVIDIMRDEFEHRGVLPISPGSTLTWLGFAWNLNCLTSFDSNGVLRMLLSKDYSWVPVLHARGHCKGRSDFVWPTYVTPQNLMCHVCRGGRRAPHTLPRPVPQALPIRMPFLNIESESEKLQEQHTRLAAITSEQALQGMPITGKDQIQLDKLLLKNVKIACKAGRSVRALDLTTRLIRKKSLDTAIIMANHLDQTQLVERMNIIVQAKEAARARAARRGASRGRFSAPKAAVAAPKAAVRQVRTPNAKTSTETAKRVLVNKTPNSTSKQSKASPATKKKGNPFAQVKVQSKKNGIFGS